MPATYAEHQTVSRFKAPITSYSLSLTAGTYYQYFSSRHCNEYSVLGFDCEWVTVGGARRPVALLQLASHRGLCALIRLSDLSVIPSELKVNKTSKSKMFGIPVLNMFLLNLLKEILEDANIVKVGVAPLGDANYLVRDYGICVASTLDLRYLAIMCGHRPGGLAKLSEDHLNVKLDKNWRIRCSDWEASTLTSKQIEYAAKDAHVAIELFKKFANKLNPKSYFSNTTKYVEQFVNEYCFNYFDTNFSGPQNFTKNQKTKQNDSV